jgi:hypothetical protein
LRLRRADRVVVAGNDDDRQALRELVEPATELGVLLDDVGDREVLLLPGVDPDPVDQVARDDDVVDRRRELPVRSATVEELGEMAPALGEERFAAQVEVGEEERPGRVARAPDGPTRRDLRAFDRRDPRETSGVLAGRMVSRAPGEPFGTSTSSEPVSSSTVRMRW